MHMPQARETRVATDLWRGIQAHLAQSKPCSTISVLVSALRPHGKAGDGVAFIPLHGVKDGDGGEVDAGLFLQCTHMTRWLDCLGRFHGSSLCPWERPVVRAHSSVELFLRHHSWWFHRTALCRETDRINGLSRLTATHSVHADLKSEGEKIHPSNFCHSQSFFIVSWRRQNSNSPLKNLAIWWQLWTAFGRTGQVSYCSTGPNVMAVMGPDCLIMGD